MSVLTVLCLCKCSRLCICAYVLPVFVSVRRIICIMCVIVRRFTYAVSVSRYLCWLCIMFSRHDAHTTYVMLPTVCFMCIVLLVLCPSVVCSGVSRATFPVCTVREVNPEH